MCSHQVGQAIVRDEVLCFGRQTLAKPNSVRDSGFGSAATRVSSGFVNR
jgi:hypothetical protein